MNTLESGQLCAYCFRHAVRKGGCAACGKPVFNFRQYQALPTGTVLNDGYVIGQVLGEPGGFGITYLARHKILDKKYAIKELFPAQLVSRSPDLTSIEVGPTPLQEKRFDRARSAFLEEARTLNRIDGERNPEVVKIYDFFEANGTAYIVMPYYEGCTLAELVEREGALGDAEALHVLRMVLRGLRIVHREKMLHQDIKPENVYLVDMCRPVLIDFGNARQIAPESDQADGATRGFTEGFSPPEQRAGVSSPSVDIYALGALAYYTVTAKRPLAAESRSAGMALVPPISALEGRVPALLLQFIERAMDLNPARRFQSVDDAFAFLKPLLEPHFDWIGLLPPGPVARNMGRVSELLEAGRAYAVVWDWRPTVASFLWFLSARALPVAVIIGACELALLLGAILAEADAPWLLWLPLSVLLLMRIALGGFGNWLMYRELNTFVRVQRSRPAPQGMAGIRSALSARLKPNIAFIAAGLLAVPGVAVGAWLARVSNDDAIRDEVSANIQVPQLASRMIAYMESRQVPPSVDEAKSEVPSLEGVKAFTLEGSHIQLTLSKPPAVAEKQIRIEFNPASNRYDRCVNIDLPDKYLPLRCVKAQ